MLKKSLLAVMAVLISYSLIIPSVFAFKGLCAYGNNKVHLKCAKRLASTSPTQFQDLINQVNVAAAANPKYDKLLLELTKIAGNKSASDAKAAK